MTSHITRSTTSSQILGLPLNGVVKSTRSFGVGVLGLGGVLGLVLGLGGSSGLVGFLGLGGSLGFGWEFGVWVGVWSLGGSFGLVGALILQETLVWVGAWFCID